MGKIDQEKKAKAKRKDIRLTFKDDEQDIREYLESKSSATCFLKDLARLEMQRERQMIESANANAVLEQLRQLLEQKEPQAPVFNLTAQIGSVTGVPVDTNQNNTDNEEDTNIDDIDLDVDFSDIF